MLKYLAVLPRKYKILIVLLSDTILLPVALWSAVCLRLGTVQPDISAYWWLFPLVPFLTVPVFIKIGLYRAVVRFMDDKIIFTVLYGVTLSVLFLMAVVVMSKLTALPRSSVAIYWVTAIAYIVSSRFMARGILRSLDSIGDRRKNVGIYGAGRAGLQTALALQSSPEYRPVAFFDDSAELRGTSVAGIKVHHPKDIVAVLESEGSNQLLLAMPSAPRSKKREIIEALDKTGIVLKTLPGIGDLVDGSVRIEDIREVGVEDLLGRDPVPPFEELISSNIKNKTVLVTGAGGSIGSELCRQILKHAPAKIILFEKSEYALYKLELELKKANPNGNIVSVLGDVLNQEYLESLMRVHKVETVYHAAAYKHVPLVELNIPVGILNNVFGTFATAKAALNTDVKNFVLISTDKAVRPTNVMGATKRLAELILQGLARDPKNSSTRFCMVRFGNVLGSSGSVVPLFREQIRNGGPLTVTDPEVTRFFMTIPEAAQLVLQAGAMGVGGEVFVLEMGESVKILDLAKKMIELSGFEVKDTKTGQGDIAIEFIGLRPGEKLYEELLIGNDVSRTEHPRIMKAQENWIEPQVLYPMLDELRELCRKDHGPLLKSSLKNLVKEYVSKESEMSS